jgi:hypothetical protein
LVDYLPKSNFTYHYTILISNYLSIFQTPYVKNITTLSFTPSHPKIRGAYISASAHAIDSIFSLYYPPLNGWWYEIKSEVIALLEAKEYAPPI